MGRFQNFLSKMLLIAASGLLVVSCGNLAPSNQSANVPQEQIEEMPVAQKASPTPTPLLAIVQEATPAPTVTPAVGNSSVQSPPDQNSDIVVINKLIIPVQGVKKEDLSDTFKDSRSGGRVHDAIDIMAPQGTPVLAVADGEIARFFDSERGGITVYQFSADKKLIYYYAHLQRRADNLQPGQFVKQGTLIGYVGDTGNSGVGNFHLHFAIWAVNDPKRYWDGPNINPYPLFR
jgi:murein DD-endopeptidase MepM/ murein hydrolase activator NlpD